LEKLETGIRSRGKKGGSYKGRVVCCKRRKSPPLLSLERENRLHYSAPAKKEGKGGHRLLVGEEKKGREKSNLSAGFGGNEMRVPLRGGKKRGRSIISARQKKRKKILLFVLRTARQSLFLSFGRAKKKGGEGGKDAFTYHLFELELVCIAGGKEARSPGSSFLGKKRRKGRGRAVLSLAFHSVICICSTSRGEEAEERKRGGGRRSSPMLP